MEHSPTEFRWHSENGASAPAEIVEVDDSMTADKALGMLRRGTGLLWCGDFHNARQLMAAVDRRLSKAAGRSGRSGVDAAAVLVQDGAISPQGRYRTPGPCS